MSEQETPGHAVWCAFWGETIDQDNLDRQWNILPEQSKARWESAAIAAHAAVERQRRETRHKCNCGSESSYPCDGKWWCLNCLTQYRMNPDILTEVQNSREQCNGGSECRCCSAGCDCGCRDECPQFIGQIRKSMSVLGQPTE